MQCKQASSTLSRTMSTHAADADGVSGSRHDGALMQFMQSEVRVKRERNVVLDVRIVDHPIYTSNRVSGYQTRLEACSTA